MSKLDELIQEFCPDGVPFKPIESIAELKRGTSITKKSIKEGDIPVIAGGQKPAYYHNQSNRTGETIVVAGSGAYAGFVTFWTIPIFVSDAFTVIPDPEVVSPKYLFYFLKSKQSALHDMQRGGGVPHVYTKDVAPMRIPTPPLAVQKEIVNILDKFTQLEAELSAELSAELDARRKQYEYYRNQLLTFDDVGGVRRVRLMDIAHYSKSRIASAKLNTDSYVGVDNMLQNKQGKIASSHVPKIGNSTRYEIDDILIGNIRPYLKKIWQAKNTGGTNGDVLVLSIKNEAKDEISPDFLYHLLASDNFFAYSMKNSKGAKMPRGDKTMIMKYEISLPPIADQNKAVSVLSIFDKLVNNLSLGLPAEINARRKQYEYYRTKLLTFEELSV